MKKIYSLITILLASVAGNAQTEPFNFSGLLESNGWTSHSGIAGQVSSVAGSLTYTGITSTGNKVLLDSNIHSQDLNLATTDTLKNTAYMSAIINYVDATDLGTDYFTGFGVTKGTTLSNMAARVHVRPGADTDTFNLGILNAGGGGGATTFDTTNLPFGTPVFIVVKHDIATNTSSLWINPTLNSTEPAATVTNSSSSNTSPQIVSVFLRNGSATGKVEIDEIIIDNNWADVTYTSASIKDNNIEGLNIYPNPATDVVTISSNNNELKSIQLFDLAGKKVLSVETENTFNVSGLNKGLYIMKITEAGKTATRKLIVK